VELLGYPDREALLAINAVAVYVNTHDRTRWQALMERQGVVRRFEMQLRRYDGTIIWVEDHARVVRDADGRVQYYEGSDQDITERKQAEELRREMHVALANAMPGISRLDPEGRYVTVNDMYARMTGCEPGEMIGMDWARTVHPEDRGIALAAYQRMVTEGKAELEARVVRKDGSVFHKHVLMVKRVNQEGNFMGHHCFMRDISERKQAETELKRTLSLLNATLESTTDGILVVDLTGKIVSFNRKFADMWCIPNNVLASHDDSEALAFVLEQLEDPEAFLRKVRELYNDVEAESFDVLRFMDGRIFERISQPQRIGAKSVGRVWSFRDVTERKQAEEALAHALKEGESIMDTIPDILYLLDLGGNMVKWNRKVEIITGFSPSELRGRPALEFFPEEDRAIIAAAIRTAFEQGYADAEGRLLTKDGTPLPYHWTGVPLVDEHGNVIGLTGVGRDITERKRTETAREALYWASLQIQEPLGLQERLARLLQAAHDILHLDRLNILLAEPEGRWLEGAATLGTKDPAETMRIPIGPEGGGIAQAYLSQQPIIWEDSGTPVPEVIRLQPPYNRLEAFRSRAFAIFPLVVQGRAIGVMGADRKHSRQPLDTATLELLQLFAAQAAIAIQNARLYEQVHTGRERLQTLSRQLVEVQEAERRHLALELHDQIGQILTGIKLTLEMITRAPVDAVKANIGEAKVLVTDLMARVRELSLDLRPPMLDDLGLLPTLLWHCDRYTLQTNIEVNFKHAGMDRRFPPHVETAAYRIVQESLTNVARHAAVEKATVRLWATQDMLGVQIEDHGSGFDPNASLAGGASHGLEGMRERAFLLGGHLMVESAPGAGTRVTVEFPMGVPPESESDERDDRAGG
jgi:PAS domain S-box-containing protein